MEHIDKCLITGNKIENYRDNPVLSYSVNIGGRYFQLNFCNQHLDETKKFIDDNRFVLNALLLNGKQLGDGVGHNEFIHASDLQKYILDNPIPQTPNEKLENLFISLASRFKYAGEDIDLGKELLSSQFSQKHYFANENETNFYVQTLVTNGLITYLRRTHFEVRISITYDGLIKLIGLQEEGAKSNRCFVAMSFDTEENSLFYDVIQPVCEKYNFLAIRVDKIHTHSEQSINDLIIAEIKKARFIIADFTKNKDGVYFEAGYGLGRGKKVIYSCQRTHFDNLHFDLNHFPFLIYDTNHEFKEMLENKIQSFILD